MTELYKLLGDEHLEAFIGNNNVKNIYKDIHQAKNKLILDNNGKCINAMGKLIPSSVSKNKKLSHILQGYEAKALNIIGEMTSDNLVLLLHDGWVSKKKLNTNYLKARLYTAMGIEFSIIEKII